MSISPTIRRSSCLVYHDYHHADQGVTLHGAGWNEVVSGGISIGIRGGDVGGREGDEGVRPQNGVQYGISTPPVHFSPKLILVLGVDYLHFGLTVILFRCTTGIP